MIRVCGININPGKFPDGTLLLKMSDEIIEACEDTSRIVIDWLYETDAELFTLICVKRYIDEHFYDCRIYLNMPYIPHARMDRVKNEEDVFTLKYFCEIINSLHFDSVLVRDAHSNVSLALLNTVFEEPISDHIVNAIMKSNSDVLFFPDEGAMKRYAGGFQMPYAFGMKKRDWETGQILGLDIINADVVKGKRVLIVDDICSRGGTFYHSAKALLAAGAASIALYVTHLEETVFFGDLTPELIDRIYTTPSIFPRKRVEDIKAADGENWIDIMNKYD